MEPDKMPFDEILQRLKHGARAARAGWNGKGMWIRYIDLYHDREFGLMENITNSCGATWLPFIIMKTADNKLVPWLASQTDLLAADWIIV
jgi:hypothetical protein